MVTADLDTLLGTHVDPVLAPLTDQRVHRITLTVEEVAPRGGARRLAATLDVQRQPGRPDAARPGRRHLRDHPGQQRHDGSPDRLPRRELGLDEPMRTIPPGESLVYTFTATRSGIWMYHCSTMPRSSRHRCRQAQYRCAVIIEPDGLLEADRSRYVIVQVYLGEAAWTRPTRPRWTPRRSPPRSPDKVVFNGIANQYDQFPFQARVGERVRFWVLDAGPNPGQQFPHRLQSQFDTVYFEGDTTKRRGVDAFGQLRDRRRSACRPPRAVSSS